MSTAQRPTKMDKKRSPQHSQAQMTPHARHRGLMECASISREDYPPQQKPDDESGIVSSRFAELAMSICD
ncbi:hypothetical protein JTE90_019830 [Oedothorax gibbosus]|uniref:Uncharacterized protein n=1 Tax=Oedothorax gibbosus TaxID=931172 RepID=A0AAV6V8H2_9ARAC|nr:hypothetical protein JTE90_019830 [Oedothorax gibbosus]